MVEALIQEGWGYHDSDSQRLAMELDAASNQVSDESLTPFLNLAIHTIGDHLGDWEWARRLAESVVADRALSATTYRAGCLLSVARSMCGDSIGAGEAELLAASATTGSPLRAILDARVTLARSLVLANRSDAAAKLYDASIDLLAPDIQTGEVERVFAITSNNIASDLLDRSGRTAVEDELMEAAASTALQCWKLCGTWENEERALYLLALVANDRGRHEEALGLVDNALDIISANGGEDVDEAFLHLVATRAHLGLGDDANAAVELERADELANAWQDESLTTWYQGDRGKVVGA